MTTINNATVANIADFAAQIAVSEYERAAQFLPTVNSIVEATLQRLPKLAERKDWNFVTIDEDGQMVFWGGDADYIGKDQSIYTGNMTWKPRPGGMAQFAAVIASKIIPADAMKSIYRR